MTENKRERSTKTRVCRALIHVRALDFIPSMMRSSCSALSRGGTRSNLIFKRSLWLLCGENGDENEGRKRQFRRLLLSSRQEMIVACTRVGVVGVVRRDRLRIN